MSNETLTVTDNRTGQTYELPIVDGTVKAMDFRQMKASEDDFGLMTYDPAFTNTASCRSSITYIDGEAGIRVFVDAPEVARTAERGVTLTLTATQAAELAPYKGGGGLGKLFKR